MKLYYQDITNFFAMEHVAKKGINCEENMALLN